ncbi:MAG: hypothetical protein NTV54_17060 [Ignavibacteriales bacterium]|nr:hypothetical protein [Ignavibacteriales bacterium]
MIRRLLSLVVGVGIAASLLQAQSVYLPATHEVYSFLKRLEAKQIIHGYRTAVLPLTREDIAGFLIQADRSAESMSTVEKEQLQFYREEFYLELQQLSDVKPLPLERWHLLRYRSDPVRLNLDVAGGFTYESRAEGENTLRSDGFSFYAYMGKYAGAYFYIRDHQEGGTFMDTAKRLSPVQGPVATRFLPKNFEYDFVDAQITFDIGIMRLSIEKMPNVWGAGDNGNLILSAKAPSYPQIKLRAKLGKDVDFTYLHAWLNSGVLDSVNSYTTPYGATSRIFRPVYRSKYLASHMVEMSVADGLDIAMGESEVYGGRGVELLYLIPVMFFKGAEHYGGDSDNSQIFGTVDVNLIKNINAYLTLFIDEFSLDDFWKDSRQRNQIGVTIGSRVYDVGVQNSDILVEYTRINPWVYNHKFPDVTYQNRDYDMGHWIGQNADLLYLEANYRPLRALRVGMQYESLRKGGKLPNDRQYLVPSPEFLYGPRIKRQTFGIVAHYEAVRDLFIDGKVLVSRYSQGSDESGVFQYLRISDDYHGKFDISLGFRYNFE